MNIAQNAHGYASPSHQLVKDDAAIVKAIIAMDHSLELTVTAEGVEIEGQSSFFYSIKRHDLE